MEGEKIGPFMCLSGCGRSIDIEFVQRGTVEAAASNA